MCKVYGCRIGATFAILIVVLIIRGVLKTDLNSKSHYDKILNQNLERIKTMRMEHGNDVVTQLIDRKLKVDKFSKNASPFYDILTKSHQN